MSETITIYDLEIPEDTFNNVKEKLEKLDTSRNYGKKHTGRQAFKLLEGLLEKEEKRINKDIERAEKRINDIKQILDD